MLACVPESERVRKDAQTQSKGTVACQSFLQCAQRSEVSGAGRRGGEPPGEQTVLPEGLEARPVGQRKTGPFASQTPVLPKADAHGIWLHQVKSECVKFAIKC